MASRAAILGLLAVGALLTGCLNIDTPDEIRIGSGVSAERLPPDVPETKTHAEAREYLIRAYRRIDELERENARLRRDRDKYKDKYERLKDKYDD